MRGLEGATMKLYTGAITPNGKRVRICASECGVPLDIALVDFQKGENRSADYLALNPMGKVPTLADGDVVLWESGAILCYLAQKSGSALWPNEPAALADMLRWLFFCACHVDPYFTTLVVERFIKARRGAPADEALCTSAEQWLARFLPVLEQQLTGREYLPGRFGLADIALGSTMELSPLVKYDLAPFPNVRHWLERLQARESWREATAAMR
jgi:glutathione S-transferase